jgi:NAD(P)H dehydrogenase (quinone)
VEAGLRYSEPDVVKARLKQVTADLIDTVNHLDGRPSVPFNTKAEWGDDGRIKPDAPSHSAFLRHNEHLDLG